MKMAWQLERGISIVLEVEHVTHRFVNGDEVTTVLEDIQFRVEKGEIVSLLGSSGSGKSTLLNLMAGLMKPTEGAIRINGHEIHQMNENELAEFRRGSYRLYLSIL